MSATGLTTSTPSFPARARSHERGVGASEDEARVRRIPSHARPDVVEESFHGEDVRTVPEPARECHDGASRPRDERPDVDAVRDRACPRREVRRVERRRREEDGGALGRAPLGPREARRLRRPVRPPPRRGVVVRGLPRRVGERVDVVHDARQRGQGADGCARRRGRRTQTRRSAPRAAPRAGQGRKIPRRGPTAAARRRPPPDARAAGSRDAVEAHRMDGRRILHSKNLFPSPRLLPRSSSRSPRWASASRCSSARSRSPVCPVPGRRGTRRTAFTRAASRGATARARRRRGRRRDPTREESRRDRQARPGDIRRDIRCAAAARRARATRRATLIFLEVKEAGGRPGAPTGRAATAAAPPSPAARPVHAPFEEKTTISTSETPARNARVPSRRILGRSQRSARQHERPRRAPRGAPQEVDESREEQLQMPAEPARTRAPHRARVRRRLVERDRAVAARARRCPRERARASPRSPRPSSASRRPARGGTRAAKSPSPCRAAARADPRRRAPGRRDAPRRATAPRRAARPAPGRPRDGPAAERPRFPPARAGRRGTPRAAACRRRRRG